LLRLFAGMPLSVFRRQGMDRAAARHILDGHLPDSIRLRRAGMPASPDHITRLQRQAPQARARIAAFRRADIDEWLDLDWLDQSLERIAANGPAHVDDANQVQLTAINAEVLTWWRTRR
jgi:asparagine synthase (glutamine-hydrolysing)